MRKLLLILFLTPALAAAQGWVIPRPCMARPCPSDGPCFRCDPRAPTVVRQSSDVRAELANGVLRYEVSETFVNRGSGIGEADYLLPLPKGAAFQDLKLSINGELVSGETLNAAEARQIYEQIVRQRRDPALVEWMGYGLLHTRIFPIAPGEEKKVVVRFQSVAEREGDALRMDYFRGTRPNPQLRQSNPEGRTSLGFSVSQIGNIDGTSWRETPITMAQTAHRPTTGRLYAIVIDGRTDVKRNEVVVLLNYSARGPN